MAVVVRVTVFTSDKTCEFAGKPFKQAMEALSRDLVLAFERVTELACHRSLHLPTQATVETTTPKRKSWKPWPPSRMANLQGRDDGYHRTRPMGREPT